MSPTRAENTKFKNKEPTRLLKQIFTCDVYVMPKQNTEMSNYVGILIGKIFGGDGIFFFFSVTFSFIEFVAATFSVKPMKLKQCS
jgi:hypothetical protein